MGLLLLVCVCTRMYVLQKQDKKHKRSSLSQISVPANKDEKQQIPKQEKKVDVKSNLNVKEKSKKSTNGKTRARNRSRGHGSMFTVSIWDPKVLITQDTRNTLVNLLDTYSLTISEITKLRKDRFVYLRNKKYKDKREQEHRELSSEEVKVQVTGAAKSKKVALESFLLSSFSVCVCMCMCMCWCL